jgi:hypothetical protein
MAIITSFRRHPTASRTQHQAKREGRHDHCQHIPEQAQQPIIQPPEDAYHDGQTNALPSVEVSAFAGARSNVECQLSPGQSEVLGRGGRAWRADGGCAAGRCATK